MNTLKILFKDLFFLFQFLFLTWNTNTHKKTTTKNYNWLPRSGVESILKSQKAPLLISENKLTF